MPDYKTVFIGLEYPIIAHTWSQSVVPESEKESITWKKIIDGKETDLKGTGEAIKYTFKKEEQGKRIIFKALDKTKMNHAVVLAYVSRSSVSPSWLDEKGHRIEETPYGRKTIQFELLFQDFFIKELMTITITLEDKNKSFSENVFTGNGKKIDNKIIVDLEIDPKWRNKGPKESLYNLYLSAKVDGIFLFDKIGSFFTANDVCNERLLIKDFFVDEEGFVINPRVEVMNLPNFGRKERPNIFNSNNPVKAIVLHRTDGKSGDSAYTTAKSSDNRGGHFTIEGGKGVKTSNLSGKDGAIYQFANLKKAVNHAGNIRVRPGKGILKPWSASSNSTTKDELKKKYPDRFPYNGDSVGIEVVGECTDSWDNGWEADWEKLTDEQATNVVWLTNGLLKHFSLDKEADIYVHEQISSKTWDEGGTILNIIKLYLE